jgi:hypothetical protein
MERSFFGHSFGGVRIRRDPTFDLVAQVIRYRPAPAGLVAASFDDQFVAAQPGA